MTAPHRCRRLPFFSGVGFGCTPGRSRRDAGLARAPCRAALPSGERDGSSVGLAAQGSLNRGPSGSAGGWLDAVGRLDWGAFSAPMRSRSGRAAADRTTRAHCARTPANWPSTAEPRFWPVPSREAWSRLWSAPARRRLCTWTCSIRSTGPRSPRTAPIGNRGNRLLGPIYFGMTFVQPKTARPWPTTSPGTSLPVRCMTVWKRCTPRRAAPRTTAYGGDSAPPLGSWRQWPTDLALGAGWGHSRPDGLQEARPLDSISPAPTAPHLAKGPRLLQTRRRCGQGSPKGSLPEEVVFPRNPAKDERRAEPSATGRARPSPRRNCASWSASTRRVGPPMRTPSRRWSPSV